MSNCFIKVIIQGCEGFYFLLLRVSNCYTRMRRLVIKCTPSKIGFLDVQIRPKALEMSPILYNKCQRQKQRGFYWKPLQFFIFNLHRRYILLSKYILQTAKTVTGWFQSWNQWAIKWHFGKLAKVRLNESESHTGNDQLSPLAVKVFASMEPFDLFTFEHSKYFLCLRYNALRSMIVLLCFLKSEF